MTPNRAEITAYLEMFTTFAKATGVEGVLVLTRYGENPHTGKKLPSLIKHFPIGDVGPMVEQTMGWTIEQHMNVYLAPVLMRSDLPARKRGGKDDIVAVFGLVADYDDADAANWPIRVPIVPSWILETSPGRFQTGFLLDPSDAVQAATFAKRLQLTAKCDAGTKDIDHVWRIPGTLNWPNRKKFKEGRSLEPVLVRTVPGGTGAVVAGLESVLMPLEEMKKKPSPEPDNSQQDHALEFTLDEVEDMLSVIPAHDRDLWRAVGIILGRYFQQSDPAWTVYVNWANKDDGVKGPGHDERMRECFYTLSQETVEKELSIGTIIKLARDNGWAPKAVLEMNKQYAVVWMGGDCVILREYVAPDTGLLDISFCNKAALKLFHANDAKVNSIEHWLKHPKRRTYHGLVFQPGCASCKPSLYNLWQGFAVKPKQGDCSLYLAHLRDNICRGNKEIFLYLLAWMANIVQTPGNRPGVAIVLRGKQGAGKGVFAKGFGRLFVPHFAHITNSHQLVGRFNALLKKAVLVFADEAFWAGDKQAEGTLNALITEETHNIEPKGIDPFSVRNFMHLIIASNHEWVIPAASEARRWLVVDVSEDHLQDHAYFKAIDTQMKNGGREALLYELLNYDGSGVDLWTVPRTAALSEQKLHSMTPVEKFWFGCLEAGSQIGGRRVWNEGIYAHDEGWQTPIRAAALYDAYVARSQQAGVKRRAMEMELADALKRMVPQAEHKRMTFGEDQARAWIFPPLWECRKAFDQYMNWTYDWPQGAASPEAHAFQLGLYEQGRYERKDDLVYGEPKVDPLEMDS